MAGAFAQIVSTEGPRALFRGLTPTLIQIAPQTGLHFGFYTAFTTLWRSTLGPDKESQGEPTTRKSAEIGESTFVPFQSKETVKPRDPNRRHSVCGHVRFLSPTLAPWCTEVNLAIG